MENIISILNEYSTLILIGLGVLVLLLIIVNIVLLIKVRKTNKRYKKMMRGIEGENLEVLINKNIDKIQEGLDKSQLAIEECNRIEEKLQGCVSKVAVKRFRAFEDVGSDLSFSIAILDSYNDGVVVTGIYSRHDSTTYAKPISNGKSAYSLSQEEKEALQEAINK